MKYTTIVTALLLAVLASSCNRGNTNPVFANSDPSSKVYKQELAKQLKERHDLKFTFNQYVNIAGNEYLDVVVSGKDMQAKSLIRVNNWGKLQGIKNTQGLGYRGAELKNLQLDIANTDTEPTFIYKNVDQILD